MKKIIFFMFVVFTIASANANIYVELTKSNYSQYYVKIGDEYMETKYTTSGSWVMVTVNGISLKSPNFKELEELVFFLKMKNAKLVTKKSLNVFEVVK
ncbi:MAG: hypothetical protein ACRCSY_02595 [Cetobacterium sp.]